VLALASDEVHDAFKAARGAHLDVLTAIKPRQDGAEDNLAYLDASPGEPPPVDIGALSRKIRELQDEANAADDRLAEQIRQELLAGLLSAVVVPEPAG
jgi:hypothetical protein